MLKHYDNLPVGYVVYVVVSLGLIYIFKEDIDFFMLICKFLPSHAEFPHTLEEVNSNTTHTFSLYDSIQSDDFYFNKFPHTCSNMPTPETTDIREEYVLDLVRNDCNSTELVNLSKLFLCNCLKEINTSLGELLLSINWDDV